MVSKIIVKPLAEIDINESVNWYELHNEKLAEEFLFELRDAVRIVSNSPLGFAKRYKEIRAFSLNKFPYNIYYIIENDTMFIVAVLHQKRNPKILKTRK